MVGVASKYGNPPSPCPLPEGEGIRKGEIGKGTSPMKNNKGFTLIEMIMVIILIGIVAAVIAIPLSQGVKGWFQATSREGISQSGRIGIERMAREIRNTARRANNTPCIAEATSTSFEFSDASGDLTTCNVLSSTNFIRFSRIGASAPYTIQRNGVVLADNIQNLTITYYNSTNGTPPAATTDIRRLSIEIISTQGVETLRKYSEVYLFNMKGY